MGARSSDDSKANAVPSESRSAIAQRHSVLLIVIIGLTVAAIIRGGDHQLSEPQAQNSAPIGTPIAILAMVGSALITKTASST